MDEVDEESDEVELLLVAELVLLADVELELLPMSARD